MTLKKEDIRLLLSKVLNIDAHANLSYQYLSDGITNENYWIKLNGDEYVLRLNNPDAKSLGIDHLSELLILDKVSELNIAVKPFYNDAKKNIRLSHWQKGQSWKAESLEKPIQLNRLAERLKQLHKVSTQGLPVLDLIQRVDRYRSLIIKRRGNLSSLEQKLLQQAVQLIASMQYSMPSALCHNDLLTSNILEAESKTLSGNSHLIFLDWEYAAVGHPLFELAVICQGNNISQISKEYLLSAYVNASTSDIFYDEFEQWCWLYDYLSFLWGMAILPIDIALPDNIETMLESLLNRIPIK